MGSDHKFDLTQANDKRDAWDSEPDKANTYKGNQILLNGGRLFFNAKEEGIFLSAVEGIGLNGKVVGIDGEDYVALDATKVYFTSSMLLISSSIFAFVRSNSSLFRSIVVLFKLIFSFSTFLIKDSL